MYSLKEAAKVWNDLLFKKFREIEVKEMESAPCVFLGEDAMLIFYVHDLIVFVKFEGVIDSIEQKLRKTFSIKNLGKLEQFLGIEITWHENGSVMTKQTKLIKTLLKITGISKSKSVRSPVDTSLLTVTVHQH